MMLWTNTPIETALPAEDAAKSGYAHNLPPSPPAEKSQPPYIIDHVLEDLVRDAPNEPLVGYPKSAHGVTDYEYYTPCDLHRFAIGAVKWFKLAGLPEVCLGSRETNNEFVADDEL